MAEPLLGNIVLFARVLRRAGIPVSLEQTVSFARSLDWLELGDRRQVFHAARSFLVFRHEDLALFESLFNRFFRVPGDRLPDGHRRRQQKRAKAEQRLAIATYLSSKGDPDALEIEIGDRSASYSADELLQQKEFAEMSREELDAVRRLMREIRWRSCERRTRRFVPEKSGARVSLRRMLRTASKHGGVPFRLPRLDRKVKERPLVLLADVSGSMEKYSRLLLQFFYGVTHSLSQVESFVFGTRLTRITPSIRLRNIDKALDQASREVIDWSGGTRIGDSLREFNRRWGRRVLRRGAVVVIVSDGWERGDVALLEREMVRLRHSCYRLIWLNPLLGMAGYEPLTRGLQAALPFTDDFLPVHNLESLEQLGGLLRELPARRERRGAVRAL